MFFFGNFIVKALSIIIPIIAVILIILVYKKKNLTKFEKRVFIAIIILTSIKFESGIINMMINGISVPINVGD